jgi:ribosome-binding factor A
MNVMTRQRSQRPAGPTQRQLRVGELVRHEIAALLERGEIRDPELQGLVVTVTEVRPAPDLKSAIVYVMPLGGIGAEIALAALSRAAPFVRRRVAEAIELRYAPELRFALDDSFERADRVERLLRSPEVARDLEGEDDDGA